MLRRNECVLVSACLCGQVCRYHGRYSPPRHRLLDRLRRRYRVIPVCPEVLGGLSVPRPPAYHSNGRIMSAGRDVTGAFERGARRTLALARRRRVLKFYGLRHSPSCDPRAGVAALALADAGVITHYG